MLKTVKVPVEMVMLVFQCVLELRPVDGIDPKEGWKKNKKGQLKYDSRS